ncbi:uncharacterized protein KD926_011148 [Aspergillus affinis]|uniref:uncharacterized protein n=1 Tax=Aspergillus affinis TaxID=1070780 RepID=UPI0022FE3933|nr:uncharacterized protein KD926_011148 [Aspergillus affinis]KAI9038209.1 hypothetical protein KD926_011148 [Aspergillus affinis]
MSPDKISRRNRLLRRLSLLRTKPLTEFFFLLDLPNELILFICHFLTLEKDINNFSRCSRRLQDLLTSDLYRHNIIHYAGSALVWAISRGQAGTVEKILRYGGDPNLCVDPIDQRPPLSMAIATHQFEITKLLLESGKCMIEKADLTEGCSLSKAVSQNDLSLVELLLRHGAGAKIGLSVHRAFRIALCCGHTNIMRLMLEQAAIDVNGHCQPYRAPFLNDAARYGRAEPLSLLLACKDLDIENTDIDGNTALMIAAREGKLQAMKTLLARGAIPDAVNKKLESALFLAASRRHDQAVTLLLQDYRVNIESPSEIGFTALMAAARYGHDSTVRLLLQNGADPNRRDHLQYSALSIAAACGKPSTCKILLENGDADVNVQCGKGRTPLSLALYAVGRSPIKQHGKYPPGADKALEVAQVLLSASGIDPDSKDHDGRTPLTYAAGIHSMPLVELLLKQASVQPDTLDNYRRTPLFYATQRRVSPWVLSLNYDEEHRVINTLLDTGRVDVNVKDTGGRTALSHAAEEGREDIVKMLIQKGADPTIVNNSGESPLHYAKKERKHCHRDEKPCYRIMIAILKKHSGTGRSARLLGRMFRKRRECKIQRD